MQLDNTGFKWFTLIFTVASKIIQPPCNAIHAKKSKICCVKVSKFEVSWPFSCFWHACELIPMRVWLFLRQSPLPDQEGPSAGSMSTFELMSSKDLAYQMTMFDWELFSCVHEVLCTKRPLLHFEMDKKTSKSQSLAVKSVSSDANLIFYRTCRLMHGDRIRPVDRLETHSDSCPLLFPTARAALPHIRPPELQKNNG